MVKLILVDRENPTEFKSDDGLVVLIDTSKPVVFKRFNAYIKLLIELRYKFKTENMEIFGEELALVNYYRYLAEWNYIFNMYIETKRYKIKDMQEYKRNDSSDILFEFEGIIKFFYLIRGMTPPDLESIISKYAHCPLYLLQRLYKKYVNPSYTLIKEHDAYSEFITIII